MRVCRELTSTISVKVSVFSKLRQPQTIALFAARFCPNLYGWRLLIKIKKFLAQQVLSLCGWRLEGSAPDAAQCVLIAAPHTSNWDFVWMKLMAWALEVPVSWLGKHTLFMPPFGGILKMLGGIPVDRRSNQNLVEQVTASLASARAMALAIPAEGTRSATPYWRSGFYHIASAAKVPIVLSYLDYGKRRGGIGLSLLPSGDMVADMDQIRAAYDGMQGKYPQLSGPIRLRDEDGE
jgi:1-acyl-sn-glycerol-3-phosphate acyltransferase